MMTIFWLATRMEKFAICSILFLSLFFSKSPFVSGDAKRWNDLAQSDIQHQLNMQKNENVAKNIILFLGDGMGVSTVSAAGIVKSQLEREQAKGHARNIRTEDFPKKLVFEDFPNVGLVKTYNTNFYVPDSAGTATAYLCGVKSEMGVIALDDTATYNQCPYNSSSEVDCISHWAQAQGKDTGFVTKTRVTHASPSPLYAKCPSRYWEADIDRKDHYVTTTGNCPTCCPDLASQIIDNVAGQNIKVIMGGGRRKLMPKTEQDPSNPELTGDRMDGRNLINEWMAQKHNQNYKYVMNRAGLENVNPDETDFLLGLFTHSHMAYTTDTDYKNQPTLAEMTRKSIEILRKNEEGYFLFIEGGMIDLAHHYNQAKKAILDVLEMEEAVAEALKMVDTKETLVVVTADHSHPMAIGGFPRMGRNIFEQSEGMGDDGKPYTSFLYTNGPGFALEDGGRQNITEVDTEDAQYRSQSAVPRSSSTHSGEDVAVYATGPMSHLFRGVQEQSYVAHVMAHAACLGQHQAAAHCSPSDKQSESAATHVAESLLPLFVLVFVMLFQNLT